MSSVLAAPLNAVDEAAALKNLAPDLGFLFTSVGVPPDVQAMVSELLKPTPTVPVFAKVEDTVKEVRAWIKSDVQIDPTVSSRHRTVVAQLLTAWEAATKRVTVQQTVEAESRAPGIGMPREIQKGTYLELVRAHAVKMGRELPDKETPAKTYMETRFEEIEDGELRAETLSDVMSRGGVVGRYGPDESGVEGRWHDQARQDEGEEY